ncbi:Crp/Fnr family transcriptional regulator [Granulicella arctica]|uniref:Crp/Fnr family transcriptional regulator n=1 Tax=Granulicella arctica TaxID=940613 RepID=UPI0021DF948E|nr:Crp/Fnr family transcriptional regulator [Granulicella arctica]
MTYAPFKNLLLSKFDAPLIARLDLRPIDLPLNREIEYPGNRIDHLFFLEEGMASLTTTFREGGQVEVALAGAEAVLGASVLMGTKLSLNRVSMRVAGHGFSVRTAVAALEFKRCQMFQDLTLRYLQAQFVQTAQTAGCNARHPLDQRLARWLLLCADRNRGRNLPLSHACLADMLGASRATVTVAAGLLRAQGLIEYTRGKIHLLDIQGLEDQACECYGAVRDHLANLAEYDAGTACSPMGTDLSLFN